MMNKRLNSLPDDDYRPEEDYLDYFFGEDIDDDDDGWALPYESAMEP